VKQKKEREKERKINVNSGRLVPHRSRSEQNKLPPSPSKKAMPPKKYKSQLLVATPLWVTYLYGPLSVFVLVSVSVNCLCIRFVLFAAPFDFTRLAQG
jgi:hypothetical protein